MWIRTESDADTDAIRDVLGAAFAQQPGNGRVEQRIVEALREDGALTLSLVADIDGRIAGCAVFSPVAFGDGDEGWYGLGPVAVDPRDQRNGVGTALIRAGLTELERLGAAGCVVLGEPDYYQRFGFTARPGLQYPGVPAEYFMVLPMREALPGGEVRYHPSFGEA